MADRKLGVREFITVRTGEKYLSSHGRAGIGSGDDIFTEHMVFMMMTKHRNGSIRPAGWFHKGYCAKDVDVTWLWTESHKYFAPKIEFRPESKSILKLVRLLGEVLTTMEHKDRDARGPEALIDALGAYVVEYVDDGLAGGWDDYRVVRAPGDSAMMVIARAAQGAA